MCKTALHFRQCKHISDCLYLVIYPPLHLNQNLINANGKKIFESMGLITLLVRTSEFWKKIYFEDTE